LNPGIASSWFDVFLRGSIGTWVDGSTNLHFISGFLEWVADLFCAGCGLDNRPACSSNACTLRSAALNPAKLEGHLRLGFVTKARRGSMHELRSCFPEQTSRHGFPLLVRPRLNRARFHSGSFELRGCALGAECRKARSVRAGRRQQLI
jgi:hypothetical protein